MNRITERMRGSRLGFFCWGFCLLFPCAIDAQPAPASPSSTVDLEKRVRELEEIVRTLKAERSQASAMEVIPDTHPAAGAVLPSAPGANEALLEGGGDFKQKTLAGWDEESK